MFELLQHGIQDGEGQAALVLVENVSTDCFACASGCCGTGCPWKLGVMESALTLGQHSHIQDELHFLLFYSVQSSGLPSCT